ncbi:MAG: hypothetical protein M3253_00800 [Chloroflexota bacterium]|nr:hypothetical protein [Chloroflexota bacterium]
MTPTLAGRWQTRIVLLATIGLLITLIFTIITQSAVFLFVLLYIALFGLVWDVVYIVLQRFRWDRDWPPIFAWLAALWEGAFIFVLAAVVALPGLPPGGLPPLAFMLHYGLVWTVIFLWMQGPMRALFPFWRFHGGRIVPGVSAGQQRRG